MCGNPEHLKMIESEEKYRSIVETASEIIFVIQGNTIIFANNYASEAVGYALNELITMNFLDFVHPDDKEIVISYYKKRLAGEAIPDYCVRIIHRNGTIKWVKRNATVIQKWNGTGKQAVIVFLTDITDLKNVEEKYKLLANHMTDTVFLMDLNLKLVYVSPSLEKVRGYTMDELNTLSPDSHFTPESYINVMSLFNEEMSKFTVDKSYNFIRTLELEYIRRDGSTFWSEGKFSLIRDEKGDPLYILGEGRDINERKKLKKELVESEEKYRTLVDKANEGIMIAQDGKFAYVNPKMEEVTGYTSEELIGTQFAPFIHPDDVGIVMRRYEQRISGDTISDNYCFRIVNKNKDIVTLQLSAKQIQWEGRPATLNMFTDVTEQKRMEENILKLEKMESLGLLAGGVAHDLNNVLGVITGYAQLLLLKVDDPDNIKTDVKSILDASFKAACMVDDLLMTARRGVNTEKVININDVIDECIASNEYKKIKKIKPSLVLETDLKSELNILGSPLHVSKSLINLINNAVESMKNGKNILRITTNDVHLYKPVRGYDEVVAGDYVVLTVSDTGEGISEKDISRIFEPFYTKKVMGKSGTGLGLSVVWGTVKDHNGYINVTSTLGEGTTFTLYFPVSRKELYEEKMPESTKWYMGSGQSILIVDDIEPQRELANIMLTKMNYKTKVLASGEEAIEYLKENSADLIILDMDMSPKMDGLQTFMKIIEINPEQKVIIISGVIESDRVMETLKLGACGFIKKPYKLEQIGLQVYKLLKGMKGC